MYLEIDQTRYVFINTQSHDGHLFWQQNPVWSILHKREKKDINCYVVEMEKNEA